MKAKILTLLSASAVIVVMASMTSEQEHIALSSGAPIGSTSAPGELTCGKSGCHTGNNGANNINTGTGIMTITSPQDIQNYTPGTTYDITVGLEEVGVARFGFSLTALDENNNKVGTLIVTDPTRMQIFQGAQQFAGREYMTYKMVGTDPYQPGKGQWSFKWKAPDEFAGKISFYAAAISANNDATDKGDLVYTKSLTVGTWTLGIPDAQGGNTGISVYPNPVKDIMHVHVANQNEPLSFTLYNMEGKKVSDLHDRYSSPGEKTISFPVSGLRPGFYYLKVQGKSNTTTEKLLITN